MGDDQPEGLSRPAIGGLHVSHQPAQHLPDAEQAAPQPGYQNGDDDEPDRELGAVVENRLSQVE